MARIRIRCKCLIKFFFLVGSVCLFTFYVNAILLTRFTRSKTGENKNTELYNSIGSPGAVRAPTDHIKHLLQHGNGIYNLYPDLKGKTSFSQYGQDQYIDKLYNGMTNGFFVEIGGYDGQALSNTLFLERTRGWTGVLIEANPYYLPLIMNVNRNCYAINCCLGHSNTNMTFTLAGALSSADQVISSHHRMRMDNEMKNDKHYNERVTVKCFSLLDILSAIGRKRVDYFSLDVEGGEMIVLQTIDWDRLDVEVFTIETDQNRDQILAFMKDRGYDVIHKLGGDHVFQKQSSASVESRT